MENIISIKTFEDAIELLGESDKTVIQYNLLKDIEVSNKILAFLRLEIIIKALNEGWKPDFTNDNEAKWWNYFYWSGSGFSYLRTTYDYSRLPVPKSLYLKNKDLALYVKDIAFDDYKTYYLEI